jgi:DNA polymerase III subunit epsilon
VRQVILDTETTGLEVEQGHRIIEIGCVELVNRRRTDRTFHYYVDPEREVDSAAEQVHGISNDMLKGKPRFTDIAVELLAFIGGAELVIHNADFDIGFLDQEFERAGMDRGVVRSQCQVIDTLGLARRLHPGQRNSLDALCRRYGVDNSTRDYHGALLDAQLLVDVYLAMTGGQAALSLEAAPGDTAAAAQVQLDRSCVSLAMIQASPEEVAAHEKQLDLLAKACPDGALWRQLAG